MLRSNVHINSKMLQLYLQYSVYSIIYDLRKNRFPNSQLFVRFVKLIQFLVIKYILFGSV